MNDTNKSMNVWLSIALLVYLEFAAAGAKNQGLWAVISLRSSRNLDRGPHSFATMLTLEGNETCRIFGNRGSSLKSPEVYFSGNGSLRDGRALHHVRISPKAISYPKRVFWMRK